MIYETTPPTQDCNPLTKVKKLYPDIALAIEKSEISHTLIIQDLINNYEFIRQDPRHHLNLSRFCLTALDGINQIRNINELENLNLSNNYITSLKFTLFSHLTALKELDLSNNQLTSLDLHAFSYLIALYNLNLSNNQITVIHPNAFSYLENLAIINLWKNPISANDKQAGASILRNTLSNPNFMIR